MANMMLSMVMTASKDVEMFSIVWGPCNAAGLHECAAPGVVFLLAGAVRERTRTRELSGDMFKEYKAVFPAHT